MWRWLHSLPRAVRQQFHSPGASAGLHVEDLHECDVKHRKVNDNKAWTYHCRYRNEKTDGDGNQGKKGQNPEFIELWRLLHGKHSAFEAFGLSGAIALCVHFSHYNYYGRSKQAEDDCLLRRLKNTFHKFGDTCLCPDQRLHLGEVTVAKPTQRLQYDPFLERNVNQGADQGSEPQSYLNSTAFSTENFQDEKRFTVYDFKPTEQKNKFPATAHQSEAPEVSVKTENQRTDSDSKVPSDTSVPIVSIEEAFAEFEDICKKYTGIGKGIMGHQAVMKGNLKSASELWEEATALGHSKSFFNLALCYELGKGRKQDRKEAIRMYKLAVEDGHPQAMYNLATLYFDDPEHSKEDTEMAVQLMISAANLGLLEAQKYLGVYYADIETEDPEKAFHYMKLASDQQDAESQYFLGMFYEQGYGVESNTCKAAFLYNKAAESCHDDAMYNLALFHLDGIGGLPQDKHCAKRLLTKSSELGNENAQRKLVELQKEETTVKITSDEEPCHTRQRKSNADLAYLMRLNSSSSTPCLSDLVRDSFKQVQDQILYQPVSDAGTVSQIYTQLLVPRGLKLVSSSSSLAKPTDVPTINDSNHNNYDVVFEIGDGNGTFKDEISFQDEDIGYETDTSFRNLSAMHSTSLPDLMMLTCM